MRALSVAFGRGLASQLSRRMLLLAVLPFLLSILLWGSLLWLGLQPIIDAIQVYFAENGGYAISSRWLTWFGLSGLKTVIVPLLAMWALLPLMVVTALTLVATMAMPAIVRHVGSRHYPALERRRGGSFPEMLWVAASSFFIFIVLWVVTIPLCALPQVGFVVQPLLWGWLTCRVIAYAALADYADSKERGELLRRHRWSMLVMGTAAGALGVAPMLLFLGGTMSIVLFPFFALLSILLYVLVFMFSGLWFTHYGLAYMGKHRAAARAESVQHPSAN